MRGYQGDDLAAPDSIAACAKHYVAYGAAEGGRDYNTADVSEYRLRNVYLEPFRAAVEAGVATVMASFNTIDGRPVHASRACCPRSSRTSGASRASSSGTRTASCDLIAHGVAEDLTDALRQSFAAGLDMEMGGDVVAADGTTSLTAGDLTAARVDDAVRRVLRLKVALGLFDHPYVDPAAELTAPTAATRAPARAAAARARCC